MTPLPQPRTARTTGATTRAPLHDTRVLLRRSVRHVLRSPDTIVTTAIIPVMLLLLFTYVFGGALTVEGSYVNYLLPGILLITVASGVSYTAYRLFTDVSGGLVERFATMPISRAAVLWGHVLTSLVANLASLGLVVLVALAIGFRSEASLLEWLATAGVLTLFALALSWLAIIPGLLARSVDGVSAFSYPLIFLPFISSAFVPTAGMPGPVRWFAEHQPVTPIVTTLRGLLSGQPIGNAWWIALAWCTVLVILSALLATRLHARQGAH